MNRFPRSMTPTRISPSDALLTAAALLLSLSAAPALASSAVPNQDTAAPQQAAASAQQGFGPLDPSQPTGITVDQIIQRMGEREAAFAHARDNYVYRRTVKVDTVDQDTNKANGEYQEVADISYDNKNRPAEHVVFAPANTLKDIQMSPADMEDIEHRLPFILTTTDLPQYDLTYLGRQRVDAIDTYVFSVKPKVIEKNHRYFQGKVWVDRQDLEIILVNGKNVPDDLRRGHEDLSPPFTTYYEQIDGKYWFPTYTKSEGILHFPAGEGYAAQTVHMRSTVRYTDYKQFRAKSRIIYNGEDITDNRATPDAGKPAATPSRPPPPTPTPFPTPPHPPPSNPNNTEPAGSATRHPPNHRRTVPPPTRSSFLLAPVTSP